MSICIKVESAKDIPNMESWISSMYDKKVFKINIVQTRPERRERERERNEISRRKEMHEIVLRKS